MVLLCFEITDMKGIIIYKGKYSATKQYAEWLAAELGLPSDISDNIGKEQLRNYDLVVLGSSIYVGKLLIKKWIKQHVAALQGKKIFLFVVCGTPPDKKERLQKYLQVSVPGEIRNTCEAYFLPGRMIMRNLSLWDRFMIKTGALIEKEPEAKKEMRMEYDGVKKENLNELLTAIQKIGITKKKVLQQA
jgi:menaquinone-dependent protoporphyrinogen IX oxidase